MNSIYVYRTCPFCGKKTQIVISQHDYDNWCNGALVNNAFPYLTATERESIISGLCPDCQKEIFE